MHAAEFCAAVGVMLQVYCCRSCTVVGVLVWVCAGNYYKTSLLDIAMHDLTPMFKGGLQQAIGADTMTPAVNPNAVAEPCKQWLRVQSRPAGPSCIGTWPGTLAALSLSARF